jgi:hypothetical protein
MYYYATIVCPRCKSTSQLKLMTIPSGPLICPVCSEGEIEFNAARRSIIRDKNMFIFQWKNPLTYYKSTY